MLYHSLYSVYFYLTSVMCERANRRNDAGWQRGERITSSPPREKEHHDKRSGNVKKIKITHRMENDASDMQ